MIEVHELTKRYRKTTAVDQLSFQVRPGRVTGFLGPNGAGKSTTMRLILGLDTPTRGRATVNGRPYRQLTWPTYQVGALLDATAVHGGRSAYQHVHAIAQSNGISRRRVGEVLAQAGLGGVARQRIGRFSLGMKQRLGIAVALLGDPPVLMFDEPVNGLDPDGVRWIRDLLRTLAADGRTVFVSSHLMSEMTVTADHLIVVGAGRLIADASTADMIAHSSARHVRARSPRADRLAELLTGHGARVEHTEPGALRITGLDCAAVGELAVTHHLVLHELVAEHASLEEAFIELTKDTVEYRSQETQV